MEEKEEKPKRPPIPLYVGVQEVALIENLGQAAAEKRVTQLRKEAGLSRKQKLTIWKYCELMRVMIEQVIPYHFRLFILAVATTIFAYACGKFIYSKLYDMYKENKAIRWNVVTPNHLEGDIYDSAGNKKIKIEVDYITPPNNANPNQ